LYSTISKRRGLICRIFGMLCVSIPINCNAKYRDEMSLFQGTTARHRQIITVRPAPRDPCRGILQFQHLTFDVAIGRNGRTAIKREGDGKTPITSMAILYGFYRGDRAPKVKTNIHLKPIQKNMLWCDAAIDPNYNRLSRRPLSASHEEICRDDGLYDICIVLDWNIRPRKRGCGSAIFMHMAKPGYKPTAGCIALRPNDMRRLLPHLTPGTLVHVY
jgi:L,D-peptidoglycan transpeptidase YkuD (ErfK/YbiS/YcfS/YnhG family)